MVDSQAVAIVIEHGGKTALPSHLRTFSSSRRYDYGDTRSAISVTRKNYHRHEIGSVSRHI